jgi:hypothetical protein
MSIWATLDWLEAHGAEHGRRHGQPIGVCSQLGKLIRRCGKRQFGPPTEEQLQLLDRLVEYLATDDLERLMERFCAVDSWAALFQGITPPAERAQLPEPPWLRPYEFAVKSYPAVHLDDFADVTRVDDGTPMIVHFRQQREYQENIGESIWREVKKVKESKDCQVLTVVLLYWPGADGPAVTGFYKIPGGGIYEYKVDRLWERDLEETLKVRGAMMYATLCKYPLEKASEVFARIEEAVEADPDPEMRENLWTINYMCAGLRFKAEEVNRMWAHRLDRLFMVSAHSAILSSGFYAGKHRAQQDVLVSTTIRWILTIGTKRFGKPSEELTSVLNSMSNLERLEQIASRIIKATDWPSSFQTN